MPSVLSQLYASIEYFKFDRQKRQCNIKDIKIQDFSEGKIYRM